MKLKLRFFAIRDSTHAAPDRPDQPTVSARLVALAHNHPKHTPETRENCLAVWPNGVNGEMELHYCDPSLVRNLVAGTMVDVTLEIPD